MPRVMIMEKTIGPALKKGTWVLCDRFSDSSFAYQGFGRELGLDRLEAMHALALGDFFPDSPLFLTLPQKKVMPAF